MPGRAVRIRGAGGVEVLELVDDYEVAGPGPAEAIVDVAAAGLNRADCLQRRGLYPAPAGTVADVPGLELSGVVAAVGDGASVAVGDRVMGIVAGGAMASRVVVHSSCLVPVPDSLDLVSAAAVPEAFFTAYDALFCQAKLALGETVLIHACASGVGTAAIQLAHVAGARTVGSSRSVAKLERCQPLGLDCAVVSEGGRFSLDDSPNVILDAVGGAYLEQNVNALAPRGRIVVIGLLGGAQGSLPLGKLLARRGTIMGTVLRTRSLPEKAALSREIAERIVPLFATGRLVPVIDAVMPMADIQGAHTRMERNETFGKIVMSWT